MMFTSWVLLCYFYFGFMTPSIHSFEIWSHQYHSNCTKFDGCLTMADRSNYLDPNATSIPCGFLAPSDLDKVRQHFKHDKQCEVIVYSLIFEAYNIIYNPISYTNYLKHYSTICFYLFVDKSTVLNGYSLEHIGNGQANIKNTKHKLNSEIYGGQAWRIILLESLPFPSLAHSMKAIKFAGPRIFPHAKVLLWFDPKYVLKRKLPRFINHMTTFMNSSHASVALYEHFLHDLDAGFSGAKERLMHQHLTYKANPHLDSELKELHHQKSVYTQEGLFKRHRGDVNLVIDSAVMFYRNNEETQRYFCAWANEIALFSRRDQLSEYTVREHLGIQIYKIPEIKLLYYFKKIGHQRPPHADPKFDENLNPPRNIHFHESGIVPKYSIRAIIPPISGQQGSGGGVRGREQKKSSTSSLPMVVLRNKEESDDGDDAVPMEQYMLLNKAKAKAKLKLRTSLSSADGKWRHDRGHVV